LPRDLQNGIAGARLKEATARCFSRRYFRHSTVRTRLRFSCASFSVLCCCIWAALLLSACGYGVGGRATRLPPGLKVIAVPALENKTNRFGIEQRLTEAVIREFLARTNYRIVSTEESADAVLRGQVLSLESVAVVFDTSTNPSTNTPTARATTMLVSIHVKVLLEERETKKILYENDDLLFREPYEISTNVSSFFDEQGPALDRMAKDFASRLVADVLENF